MSTCAQSILSENGNLLLGRLVTLRRGEDVAMSTEAHTNVKRQNKHVSLKTLCTFLKFRSAEDIVVRKVKHLSLFLEAL